MFIFIGILDEWMRINCIYKFIIAYEYSQAEKEENSFNYRQKLIINGCRQAILNFPLLIDQ